MKWRQRLLIFAGIAALLLPGYGHAAAQSAPRVLISEIQTGSGASATEEFIELYNDGDAAVDLEGWRIEYFPAAAADFSRPTRTVNLSGSLEADSYYLLASREYLADVADLHYSYVLAGSGGHVRLVRPDTSSTDGQAVQDLVAWGSGQHPETEAAPAAPGGKTLVRLQVEDGSYKDSDNNASDFAVSETATPRTANVYPVASMPGNGQGESLPPPAENNEQPEQQPDMAITPPALPERQAKLLTITELLPDPAPPETDAEHEFVELYNPNAEPVSLEGYKLQTGNNFTYSFVFAEQTVLEPNSYRAFYASETGVTLANGGGRARLLDTEGRVVAETAIYEDAEKGQAWVLHENSWHWTTKATPGTANQVISAVPQTAATAAAAFSKKPAKTAAKPASKAKSAKKTGSKSNVAAAKTSKAGKPGSSAGERESYEAPAETNQVTPLHPGVLAAVGGLALLYGLYEYRQDIRNRIYQFRQYRTARRAAGKAL